nr:hypothetical protein [Anaerolineae bacterium]
MTRRNKLLALLVLLLAALACSNQPGAGPVLSGTVTHTAPTPVPPAQAQAAIRDYARNVLGLEIGNIIAGGAAGQINLPVTTKEGVDAAMDLAATTYFGLWENGLASLSVGDTTISSADSEQDLIAEIEDGALGVFAISLEREPPPNPAAALDLIRTTYPGLAGFQFTPTPVERGFAFTSARTEDINITAWGIVLTATTVNAGAGPGINEGRTLVWVVVASGALRAPFK